MVKMMDSEPSNELQWDEPLGRVPILSYGSGHMLNDITSSCWFTYLLVFLTDLGLSPRYVLGLATVNY
jgi:Na+/melibiose symporter-like transporter